MRKGHRTNTYGTFYPRSRVRWGRRTIGDERPTWSISDHLHQQQHYQPMSPRFSDSLLDASSSSDSSCLSMTVPMPSSLSVAFDCPYSTPSLPPSFKPPPDYVTVPLLLASVDIVMPAEPSPVVQLPFQVPLLSVELCHRRPSVDGSPSKAFDTFRFDVPLLRNNFSRVEFCVCFVAGSSSCEEAHWDSNEGKNFVLVSHDQYPTTTTLTPKDNACGDINHNHDEEDDDQQRTHGRTSAAINCRDGVGCICWRRQISHRIN
uniref:CBM21 domain-containing protein n=1 Tax=Globodera pallida TaxID=36090 RepID=A0A183CPB2_GLOPA